MIRRLHFEEVQSPPHALNPAGEIADPKDDKERQSLALEFRELLAKVGGGAASLVDQSTALGLALAQAMPAERLVHQDLKKIDSDQLSDEDDQLDVLDDGADRNNQPATIEETESNEILSTSDNEVEGESEAEVSQAEAILTKSDLVSAQDEVSTATTSIVGKVLEADIPHELTLRLDSNAENETGAPAQSGNDESYFQTTSANQEKAQETAVFQGQIERGPVVDSRIKVVDHKQDEASEDELELTTSSFDSNSVDVADSHRAYVDHSASKDREFKEEFNQPAFSQAPTQESASQEADSQKNATGRYKILDSMADTVSNRAIDAGRKDGKADGAQQVITSPEAISTPVSKGPVMRPDHSVQMTLLRQAFESIHHARQESPEGGPKLSSMAVQGAAVTSQSRRSEADVAARGQRGLARSHVTRMLERVESSLKEAARARDGKTISLRLDPLNLGRVKVDVSLRDGGLHARITAENQQVMTALRDHAHELHGTLRKLGLNVDTVSVTVSGETTSEEPAHGGQMENGSSFQHEGHNLPQQSVQVPEFRIGNELAEWRRAGAPEEIKAVDDHWVA